MQGVAIGVIGGSGGVGASTFAAVLAVVARPAVLVDLDPVGGGADVLLGIEARPGARWSGVRLDGGRLDPALLADGLPRWRDVAVLAADRGAPTPGAALQVIDAARQLGAVVLDLPRAPGAVRDAALARCALTVVVAAAEVPAVAAARAVLQSFPALPEAAIGVVLRRGQLAVGDASDLIGVRLLGTLPPPERDGTRSGRLSRPVLRVAAGVLDGVADGMLTGSARAFRFDDAVRIPA